ncbi:hypothetical protein H4R27_003940 [Coemansia aciculifera]|nr:hypothetical protein H4R27_003940 [Coemansia aciculifera]
MSFSDKVCLKDIEGLYAKGAYFETYAVEPKTRVELRMIKASAFIRSSPEWSEQLNDENKRQEWAAQVKDTYKLIDKDVEYIFEELEYYALLKKNGVDGEELGSFDNVWTNDSANDSELAKEIKYNAAVLESDFAQGRTNDANSAPPVGSQVLVDPFLYPFVASDSQVLAKPTESPEDWLNPELLRVCPGSLKHWAWTINYLNNHMSNRGDICDERKFSHLVNWDDNTAHDKVCKCWLPTDFDVKEDGSVVIRSYINNLHPTRYAALYQTISKVFAKFVPLLEQVTTDVIHPRGLRAVFSRSECCVEGLLEDDEVTRLLFSGESLPEEFNRFVTTSSAYHPNGYGNSTNVARGVSFDSDAYSEAWEDALEYTEPAPLPFHPSDRPLAPLSMRGLPLQASVEMFNVNLTPENPSSLEGVWRTVGRAEERIFAVGLYFYDVENVASANLTFRDPMSLGTYHSPDRMIDFRSAHDVNSVSQHKLYYSQEVGGIEIKDGRYICYPNYYQTKMPSFELVDPTKAGHIKCIAFYIADPTTRLLSTEVIPPQQPDWAMTGEPPRAGAADEDACNKRDHLRSVYAAHSQSINERFDACAEESG